MKTPMKALSDLCLALDDIREWASAAAREANGGFTVISYGEDGKPDPRSYSNATTPEQAAEWARLENGGLDIHGVYPGTIGIRVDLNPPPVPPRFYIKLEDRAEFDTILAALRYYQSGGRNDVSEILDGADIDVDDLCERINS